MQKRYAKKLCISVFLLNPGFYSKEMNTNNLDDAYLFAFDETFCPLMDGPGTMTWEEFVKNAECFLRISNEISDGWKFCGNKDEPGQAYLMRRKKISYPIMTDQTACIDSDENFESVLQEDPFTAQSLPEQPLLTEHHILWSLSYSVPVLYFNGWRSDFPGVNVISVEEAQKFVDSGKLGYNELSQAIHPILGAPFLFLHPCLSHELLSFTSRSKNKLVSWISSVAPAALHLTVQSEYSKLV